MAFADAIRNEISIPSKESPLCSLRGVPGLCSMLGTRPACETHEPGVSHLPIQIRGLTLTGVTTRDSASRSCLDVLQRPAVLPGATLVSFSPEKTRRNSALASQFAYWAGRRAVARKGFLRQGGGQRERRSRDFYIAYVVFEGVCRAPASRIALTRPCSTPNDHARMQPVK